MIESQFMKTHHCQVRCSQRGVGDWKIRLAVTYVKPQKKRGACIYSVRNKDVSRMLEMGVITGQEADKIRNLVVILARDSWEVITVYYASDKTLRKIYRN